MMRNPVGCPYLAEVRARWDGELPEARAAGVEAHLQSCAACQEEQRTLERLATAFRRGDANVSISKQQHEDLKSALLQRCVRSLCGAPHTTSSHSAPGAAKEDARSRLPGMRPCSAPHPAVGAARRSWLPALGILAITAVVAAILFPVFSQSREKARYARTGAAGELTIPEMLAHGASAYRSDGSVQTPSFQPREAPESRSAPLAAEMAPGPPPALMPRPLAERIQQDYEVSAKARSRIAMVPSSPPNPRTGVVAVGSGFGAREAKPVYNPNAYLSSTYIGGSGERDRVEKLIREGVVVQGRRVRLEAFPRDYAQAFPIPTRTALNLIAGTERTKIVQEGGHAYLQVGLQAMKGEAPRRPPLNLALVIDCSGSMGDEHKLEYAKAAALQLVDRLHADDVLSLVAFDDTARLLVPAARVRDRARVKAQIAALMPGSGTNIYDGLRLGHQEARKHTSPEVVSRVILLSDGEVTAGVSDPRRFQQLVAADVDHDIQTTAVGMGVEFNEELMLAIAREGKGNYHFLRDAADTQRVFAQELEELTHVVAKAIRLRIRLADGVGLVRVLGASTLNAGQARQVRAEEKKIDRKVYEELGIAPNRQHEPEEPGLKLLIPGFYRSDHHIVMLELAIPPGHGRRKVAEVFLKYKDLAGKVNRETQTSVSIDYTARRDEMIASVDRNVKKNLLGFQTGEALSEAAALVERGRIAEAARKIDERMVVLGVAAREWRDRDLDRDGQLLDRYKTVLAQLNRQPQMANGALAQYLKKSLTYAGYRLTR